MFTIMYSIFIVYVFFLMIRRPPRSTRTTHSFPTRRSSDLLTQPQDFAEEVYQSLLRDDFYILPLTDKTKDAIRKRYDDMIERRQPVIPDMMRSEEHTSELQSLMRISYAVFCLKKKKQKYDHKTEQQSNSTRHHYI